MIVAGCTSPSYSQITLFFFFICIFFLPDGSTAQRTTDPIEVTALNSIFTKWGVPSGFTWNVSGEPCSGVAIDETFRLDRNEIKSGIKCNCSYNDNTTCHITELRVFDSNVVGTIPEELKNLKYLQSIKLDQNYLTGALPGFIGNFSDLTFLSVAFNSFSGPFPKEIGNLNKLIILSFGHNNFSGTLPPELGNLANLQRLYINSAGLGGELPSTFSQLQNLKIVVAMDNDLNGTIPDFIGSWTKLNDLRLHGNSFQGPIPSSFSKLTNLKNLYIGEVSNGGSSLAFVENLKALETLVIRNSMISGTIPDVFEGYTRLQILDFSFNNITGTLPKSLLKIESLTHLFLGNNRLSGALPNEKSTNLVNIDLSYNEFSGNLPSWINQRKLSMNLVANNFSGDWPIGSAIQPGLNCLQRNMPCNRASLPNYQFGINCGGKGNITDSDGFKYDSDEKELGAASYYVIDSQSWAVSNAGKFTDVSDAQDVALGPSKDNPPDTELFQDVRLSASSLRYYGLGLQKGNYTVKLHFVELAFSNNKTWTSLGRRIFDIYIQEKLVEKDFDIRKEAGGVSYTMVLKEYTAPVTDSFLEIHLFWAGKGTCCVPANGNYGPSIAAIKVTPKDFTPKYPSSKNKALIAGVISGIVAVCFLLVLGILLWKRNRKQDIEQDLELLNLPAKPHCFSYSELRTATDDFKDSNKLGEGGFGAVYKGRLSDGRFVAVKRLSTASLHGKKQFVTEIATISAVQHRNLVQLYGCCFEEDRRLLVYEYLEHKSLDHALFGKSKLHLDWPTRFDICLGTARGLAYLHEESRLRIIHRDVKAANILLDSDLNPKISDFGLAKLYDEKMTHISTRVAGTLGYLAPEYAMRGRLSEKADVFAFGVVALEIVCGRANMVPSLGEDEMYLLEWAWQKHVEKCELQLVDQTLEAYNEEEAIQVIKIALLCTHASPAHRPSMSHVVGMLVGDFEVPDVRSRPGYLSDYLSDGTSDFTNSDFRSTSNQASTSVGWSSGTSFAASTKESRPMLFSREKS